MKGSVDSRTMLEVIVVLEENVEGSMVLLPMTRRGSSSSSEMVWTAEVARGADETGTDEVMVLPALSVVVTSDWDTGVLEGPADVPVSSSVSSSASSVVVGADVVSEGWSEVGEAVGAVVSSVSSDDVVGSAEVVVGSVEGGVVVSGSSVVDGGDVVALVSDVVGSSGVVSSEVVVGALEELVVTPVPTTCRLGMTPCGISWACACAKLARAENMMDEGRMVGDLM